MTFETESLKIPVLLISVFVFASLALASAEEPVLEVLLEKERARVGTPFQVVYEASWTGDPDAFAIVPGEMERVGWAETRIVKSTAGLREGRFVVSQTLELVPADSGEFEVPVFKVGYFVPSEVRAEDPESDEGSTAEPRQYETLRADAFSLVVRPNLGPYFVYGTLIALMAGLSGLGFVTYARARKTRLAAVGSSRSFVPQSVQAALNAARKHRLDGKFYEFYKEMARASSLLAPSVAARRLREKLEQNATKVGYGDVRPSDDEMDGDLKDLERAMKENPDRGA